MGNAFVRHFIGTMLDKHEDLLSKEIYWLLQEAESYIQQPQDASLATVNCATSASLPWFAYVIENRLETRRADTAAGVETR
jgi:hypothetical protein